MTDDSLTDLVMDVETSGFGPQATAVLLRSVPVQREDLLYVTMRAVLNAAAYKAIADTYTGKLKWQEGDIRDAGLIPESYPHVRTYLAKARVLDAYGVEQDMPFRLNVHSQLSPEEEERGALHCGDLPGSGSITGFSVDQFVRDLFSKKDD